jgi:hypothetical protein
MIVVAPARFAPWMTLSPTPPQPKTATLLPISTLAVLTTAPTPVMTPQPMSATFSSGASSRTFTIAVSWATKYWAKEDTPMKWKIDWSPFLRRVVPSFIEAAGLLLQR